MFRISFILIFFLAVCNGQEKVYSKIDRDLSESYNNAHLTGCFEKGIIITNDIIKRSRQLNYRKGIGTGYLNIANFLCSIDHYKESMYYLELAEKEVNSINDNNLKSQLYNEYGNVYQYLGLFEISIKYYNKVIKLNKNILSAKERKGKLIYAYTNKADVFENLKRSDSAYIYYHKAYKIIPDPLAAANIASCFINYKKNNIDSAGYYLQIASDSLRSYTYSSYQKLIVLEMYGEFYYYKKNYRKAIDYFQHSLAMSKKQNNYDEMKLIYQSISKTYEALNDDQKSADYLEKYMSLNDSLNYADKKTLNISVDKLILMKDLEITKEKEQIKYTIYYALGYVVLIVLVCFFLYRRNKRRNELLLQNQQQEINQQEIEKRNLESKINYSFSEVLQLARSNDPHFLVRFKEVYPEFCNKIVALDPTILNSELTFFAYLKLNFSTKEIANYTFVTVKAVQARKSRIRKKMNIPSDEDLYNWINNI